MIYKKHTFQKLTQFSQGKKMLHLAASNIDGFLWSDTWVSSTQLKGANRVYLHLEPPKFQEVFL
jgi:hypothetical protein